MPTEAKSQAELRWDSPLLTPPPARGLGGSTAMGYKRLSFPVPQQLRANLSAHKAMEGCVPPPRSSQDYGTQEGKVRTQSSETRPHVSSEAPAVCPQPAISLWGDVVSLCDGCGSVSQITEPSHLLMLRHAKSGDQAKGEPPGCH